MVHQHAMTFRKVLPEQTLVLEMLHALAGKVVVAGDRLSAEVAHEGATVAAGDLVAPVLRIKRLTHMLGFQASNVEVCRTMHSYELKPIEKKLFQDKFTSCSFEING